MANRMELGDQMSEAERARIAAAQRARWAKVRAAKKSGLARTQGSPKVGGKEIGTLAAFDDRWAKRGSRVPVRKLERS
jgi:hypothetical protein